jgi:nucleoside-diphosphate-sugar epimerase
VHKDHVKKVLITGGVGFFGELLKKELLKKNISCVSIDIEKDNLSDLNLVSIQADVLNKKELALIFNQFRFDTIFHLASINPHVRNYKNLIWDVNVNGTKNIAELAIEYKVPKIVYLSSSAVWGRIIDKLFREDDPTTPLEMYGKSKLEAERILLEYVDYINVVIFRSPIIIDQGRLGLLSVLFDFIIDGCRVWLPNKGENKIQYLYAQDLIDACIKGMDYNQSDIFNIGADNVKNFKDVLNYLIDRAGTNAKITYMPNLIILFLIFFIKVFDFLKLSPLSDYHCNMIGKNFILDTSKIKTKLHWMPTLNNEEMLCKAYEYYKDNLKEIKSNLKGGSNKQPVKLGAIRILKWIS